VIEGGDICPVGHGGQKILNDVLVLEVLQMSFRSVVVFVKGVDRHRSRVAYFGINFSDFVADSELMSVVIML